MDSRLLRRYFIAAIIVYLSLRLIPSPTWKVISIIVIILACLASPSGAMASIPDATPRSSLSHPLSSDLCLRCQLFLGDILTKDVWARSPSWWDGQRFKHLPHNAFPLDLSTVDCRLCRMLVHAWRQTSKYRELVTGQVEAQATMLAQLTEATANQARLYLSGEELDTHLEALYASSARFTFDEHIYVDANIMPSPKFTVGWCDMKIVGGDGYGEEWLDMYYMSKKQTEEAEERKKKKKDEVATWDPLAAISALSLSRATVAKKKAIEKEVYTSDDPFAFSISDRSSTIEGGYKVSPPLASVVVFEQMKNWLSECLQSHSSCKRPQYPLPPRVIDVGRPEDSIEPRLYISHGELEPWIALSYCWGKEESRVLETATFDSFQRRIPADALPRTITDAIRVTRALGYRFLWVDSLTIIQDSKADWTTEAARMHGVYAGAALTLSSDESYTRSAGLFAERNVRITGQPMGGGVHLSVQRVLSDESKQDAILHSRGWTLQEDILSTAVAHFAGGQVFWVCRTCQVLENGQRKSVDPVLKSLAMDGDLIKSGARQGQRPWYHLVINFSRRTFTNMEDAPAAIAGIAEQIEIDDPHAGRYLAGLWEADLPAALLWNSKGEPDPVASTWEMPSWSWIDYFAFEIKWPLPFLSNLPSAPTSFDCTYHPGGTSLSTDSKVVYGLTGEMHLAGYVQPFTEEMLRAIVECDIAPWNSTTFATIGMWHNVQFRTPGLIQDEMQAWCTFNLNRHFPSLELPLEMLRVCSWPTARGHGDDWEQSGDYLDTYFLLLERPKRPESPSNKWRDPDEPKEFKGDTGEERRAYFEHWRSYLNPRKDRFAAIIAAENRWFLNFLRQTVIEAPIPSRRFPPYDGTRRNQDKEHDSDFARKSLGQQGHERTQTMLANESSAEGATADLEREEALQRYKRAGLIAFRHEKSDDSFMRDARWQKFVLE